MPHPDPVAEQRAQAHQEDHPDDHRPIVSQPPVSGKEINYGAPQGCQRSLPGVEWRRGCGEQFG
jgi:hypothetical protein